MQKSTKILLKFDEISTKFCNHLAEISNQARGRRPRAGQVVPAHGHLRAVLLLLRGADGGRRLAAVSATTHHSFRGSFSAGSTPIFASKYAFFSIFQNLQENHLLASKFSKFLPKNWKILENF